MASRGLTGGQPQAGIQMMPPAETSQGLSAHLAGEGSSCLFHFVPELGGLITVSRKPPQNAEPWRVAEQRIPPCGSKGGCLEEAPCHPTGTRTPSSLPTRVLFCSSPQTSSYIIFTLNTQNNYFVNSSMNNIITNERIALL